MKDTLKYVAVLVAFILISFALSWAAVYAYWLAAYAFHSVAAVRVCDAVGSIALIPVRMVFWAFGDLFDQSAPLTDPTSYAALNAVLLGSLAHACCRRFLSGRPSTP